jgi:hypothetical protein
MIQQPIPVPPNKERLLDRVRQLKSDILKLILEFESANQVEVSRIKTLLSEEYENNGALGMIKELEVSLGKPHKWKDSAPYRPLF